MINTERACHIITVEDPIEYVHEHKRSAVNQREVGTDTASFPDALRSALREDPDVLLVGEMRDLDSIRFALTIAETGHLVFATLHTNDTAQSLARMIDVFPAEQQAQIRVQLAAALSCVVYQRLIPRIGGGMVAAYEVLVANSAVRNLIKEGKTHQLRNSLVTGAQDGMVTFEQSLSDLVQAGVVTLRRRGRRAACTPRTSSARPRLRADVRHEDRPRRGQPARARRRLDVAAAADASATHVETPTAADSASGWSTAAWSAEAELDAAARAWRARRRQAARPASWSSAARCPRPIWPARWPSSTALQLVDFRDGHARRRRPSRCSTRRPRATLVVMPIAIDGDVGARGRGRSDASRRWRGCRTVHRPAGRRRRRQRRPTSCARSAAATGR